VDGERVVAIDGPAGSGKTTLARSLARELLLPYVNTGLMYRALTLRALSEGADLGDGAALARLARPMRFDLDPRSIPVSLRIDGVIPSDELTSAEVEREVSLVSSHPEVRILMRGAQRRLGEGGAVMEGRDIGSVVFPDAAVKIFLVAAPGARAARRILEREAARRPRPVERIAEGLAERDERDAQVNPLVPAPDAVMIDTTDKDPEAVLREVLAIVRKRLGSIP
jgi:cytidylate kinase